MSDFRNEAHRKVVYKLGSVPLVGMIWLATCLIIVFYIFTLIPPKTIDQIGYRGVAMENIQNVRTVKARDRVNVAPDEWPPFEEEGPLASEVYENVHALGHVTQANFDRIMTLVTEWVSPDEGCNYCHVVLDDGGVDYVSDEIYTKVVSRRMFQMTQHINSTWPDHVAPSGVNCYTCHRGNPVPPEIWFTDPQPVEAAREGAGNNKGQNTFRRDNAYSSLPYETFSEYLTVMDQGVGDIRIIPTTALPTTEALEPDLNAAERTYGLMMHISEALGTNCTFCHNSRSFISWEIPQRVTAWYGIRMAQDLNENFLIPLQPEFPAARLGPLGDAPKAHCATCHQAVNKPLNGADVISSYPELAAPGADVNLREATYKFMGDTAAPAEEAAAEDPAAEDQAAEAGAVADEATAPAEEASVADDAAAAAGAAAAATEEAAEDASAATEEAAGAAAAATEEAAEDASAATEEAAEDAAAATEEAAEDASAATEEAAEDAAAATEEAAEDASAATEEAAEDAAAATEEAAATVEEAAENEAAAPTEEAVADEAPAAEEEQSLVETGVENLESAGDLVEPGVENLEKAGDMVADETAAAVGSAAEVTEDAAQATEEAATDVQEAVSEEPAAEDAPVAEEAAPAEDAVTEEAPAVEETKVEEPAEAAPETAETASAQ
ncbi:photosynthetic reaction center cytochrome c subunit [Roseospira marina]|uniref:Photosynthetic reaction center cytochrome c subunit n=1 Tax=Roseospira marina TaxID=140057 RepID=A0A5M6ID53_9PROT|nr:photosynthetic reaction center cytochrome PufC [Roseospira marina]KAA5605548.1 photosynthetic reaction center cytochrome c subunit [Roseospira marina]MBB4313391.1 hypothetical protein [Roseospira marina]MBB5085868.1 hypothetical protein [Roseospira marina]